MLESSKSRKAVSSKFMITELVLQGGGVRVVFVYITPIILSVDLKLHACPFKCELTVCS